MHIISAQQKYTHRFMSYEQLRPVIQTLLAHFNNKTLEPSVQATWNHNDNHCNTQSSVTNASYSVCHYGAIIWSALSSPALSQHWLIIATQCCLVNQGTAIIVYSRSAPREIGCRSFPERWRPGSSWGHHMSLG